MKKIILTGGGTAGHVTPNLALVPALREAGYEIEYIGGKAGIEKELAEREGLPYHAVSSGKLRRYPSLKNAADALRVIKGVGGALRALGKTKPDVIFSKGGFVTVPVAIAGYLRKIPVVIHESDLTPGLANKIALRFAAVVCVSFPETLNHVNKNKAALTGPPIRRGLTAGDRQKGLKLCGFSGKKPVLLVMGGSLGSVRLNEALRSALPRILPDFDAAHVCGKNNRSASAETPGYAQFEYLQQELFDLMAACDVVVSRAGANAVFEFLTLKKPALLIPLSKNASRGDQIQNAESFRNQGFAEVLQEEDLCAESLSTAISGLYANREKYIEAMSKSPAKNGVDEIVGIIEKVVTSRQKAAPSLK